MDASIILYIAIGIIIGWNVPMPPWAKWAWRWIMANIFGKELNQ